MHGGGAIVALAATTLLLSSATLAARAAADDRHVHAVLDWSEATGCVDADTLRAGVEAHLGRSVFDGAPDVRIVARVTSSREGTEVVLELSSIDGLALGVRTLRAPSPSCRALDRELVLVISLLIDLREEAVAETPTVPVAPPAVESSPPPPTPPHTPAPASRASRGQVAPSPRAPRIAPTPRSSPGWAANVFAGAETSVRELPGVAVAIRAGGEVAPLPFLPVEIGVAVWLPSGADRSGAGATFFGWTGRLGACLVAHADIVELGGCAAVDAGMLFANGYGLDVRLLPDRPWVDVSLRARVGLRLGAFGIRLEPGLAFPLVRDDFFFADGGTTVRLHQAGAVAGTLEIVLVWHLGS